VQKEWQEGEIMASTELIYSEDLIKETTRKYWLRQWGPFFFILLSALAVYLFYLMFTGNRTWYVGLIGAVVLMGTLIVIASYFVQRNRALSRLKKMGNLRAVFEYSDTHFKVTSDLGSSEFRWSLITKILCLDRAWILYFSENEIMTLPISNMSDETRAFILSKVRK